MTSSSQRSVTFRRAIVRTIDVHLIYKGFVNPAFSRYNFQRNIFKNIFIMFSYLSPFKKEGKTYTGGQIDIKRYLFNKKIILIIIILIISANILPSISGKESFEDYSISLSKQTNFFSIFELNKFIKKSDFDDKINVLMKLSHMPSLSTCIIKNDSIVWYKGYGYADRNNNIKPTQDSVYMIASISKTFTATAILQLYDQGLISLDDNVSKYLTFDLKNPKYPETNITPRMLLTHKSGLTKAKLTFPIYFTFLGYSFDWIDEYLIPNGGIYDENVWGDTLPGEEYCYSDIGFGILGHIVENITNQSFNDYCKNNIFKQLNMLNTSFEIGEFNFNILAIPYFYLLGIYLPLPHINTGSVCMPAGGLRTTISDLSHYLIAHMNNGFYKGRRILKEDTVKLMHSFHSNTNFSENLNYGLGWMLWNDKNNNTYGGHSGGILGGRAEMWYREFDKVGVIYFWNQNQYVNLFDKPIESKAQQRIDELLWDKANSM